MSEIEKVANDTKSSEVKQDVTADKENYCAAVQTRAMRAKESKPQKLMKVTTVPGLDTELEQLTE